MPVDRLLHLFQRGEVFFIACNQEDEPIGFASVDFDKRARLHFLSVLASQTDQGIGSSLMNRMLDECRKRGFRRAHTFVEADSPKEQFLKHFGFSKKGHLTDWYQPGRDATFWQIELDISNPIIQDTAAIQPQGNL